MHEVLAGPSDAAPAGDDANPGADPAVERTLDEILGHAAQLSRAMPSGVPDWIAAELSLGQLRLLFRLNREGPASMGRIGEWLATGLPSVTGTIERLERHGLLERRHRTDDRRIVEAHLTDRGDALVGEILGFRATSLRRLFAHLHADELRDLDRLLLLIIDRSGEGAP